MRNSFFIFGYLNDADIDWLEEVGQLQRVEADVQLIALEQPAFGLLLLLDGKLQVTDRNGDNTATLLPGEVAGEVSFILGGLSIATVTTKMPSLLLLLPAEVLNEHLQEHSDFATRFYRAMSVVLADRLQSTMNTAIPERHTVFAAGTTFKGEMSLDMLSKSGLAGSRFDRLRKKYVGQKSNSQSQKGS